MSRSSHRFLKRALSSFVVSLLIFSQQPKVYGGQLAQNSEQGAGPKKLSIVVIEGDGAINNIQQRVAREAIVQVNDENDRPVAGALVLFGLPTSGPGGTFANGTNAFSVVTDAAGRATAGFTPNTVNGTFQLNVTASFQDLTATARITQTNGSGGTSQGISTTTIAVVAAAAAAAVAIGIVATKKGGDSAPSTPTVRVGIGTPTLGAPGGWAQSALQTGSRPKWRD